MISLNTVIFHSVSRNKCLTVIRNFHAFHVTYGRAAEPHPIKILTILKSEKDLSRVCITVNKRPIKFVSHTHANNTLVIGRGFKLKAVSPATRKIKQLSQFVTSLLWGKLLQSKNHRIICRSLEGGLCDHRPWFSGHPPPVLEAKQ